MSKVKMLFTIFFCVLFQSVEIVSVNIFDQSYIGKTFLNAVIYSAIISVIVGGASYYVIKKGCDYIIEKNKEKDFVVLKPGEIKETFSSIAGYSREKQYFQDIVNYLNDPKSYENFGVKPCKGILLTGVPGVGKTMFVRALAGSCDCLFISASGADFSGPFRIKKIFEQARTESKKYLKPCIIFLDEFELLAPDRANGKESPLLITLLTELDGFIKNNEDRIILIVATNFQDKIDAAILRPGRIGKKIHINIPNMDDRKDILQFYLNKIKHEENIDLSVIVQRTKDFTGARLAAIVQSAGFIAASRGKPVVTLSNLQEALDIEQFGVVSTRKRTINEDIVTAYHESGHALVATLILSRCKVSKVSIIGRENAGGVTQIFQLNENESLNNKEDFLNSICFMLAGKAAEEVCLGIITNGAMGDLQNATTMASFMVKQFAMANSMMVNTKDDKIDSKSVENQINSILNCQYNRAVELLKNNMDKLEILKEALLEKKVLEIDQVYELLKYNK